MRSAVFVDAGYLVAQGSVLLTGTRQGRERLSIDIPKMVAALQQASWSVCDLPLLRIYWYDAMRLGSRPSMEQTALADANEIKLRLGQINSAGEQKGVDALIINDLVELARNKAIMDAVILSGDEDLRGGVLLAQQFGVRVHLIGIQPARANQSRSLVQEADTAAEWDHATISKFLSYTPPPPPQYQTADMAPAGNGLAPSLDGAVNGLIDVLAASELALLKHQFGAGGIVLPSELDRSLLRIGRSHYGQLTLSETERTNLRATFVRLVMARP
jgi:uncharacterized LabA/DUF88 family protein